VRADARLGPLEAIVISLLLFFPLLPPLQMGSGQSTQHELTQGKSLRERLKAESPWRDPAPLIDKLDAVVTEAVNLLLAMSRTTISKAGRNKGTISELVKTQLEAILSLHNYLLAVPTAASGAREAEKEFQSCISIMAERVLLTLWTKINKKYAETCEDIGLAEPTVTIAETRLHGCQHRELHIESMNLVGQMIHMVSHLNDCRTQEEYTFLMEIQGFSFFRQFITHLHRAQADFDQLEEKEKRRVDLVFTAFLLRMAEGGVTAAQGVLLRDILKLGDSADVRQIPTIRAEQLGSLTGRESPALLVLVPASQFAAAASVAESSSSGETAGPRLSTGRGGRITAMSPAQKGAQYVRVNLRSVNSSPLLHPSMSRPSLSSKGRSTSTPAVKPTASAAAAAAASLSGSTPRPLIAPPPVLASSPKSSPAEESETKETSSSDASKEAAVAPAPAVITAPVSELVKA
jgi:hypothetical protein